TSRMLITGTGNVGIGTTSPAGLLDVSGSRSATPSSTTGLYLALSASTLTDNATAASGTATGAVFNSIAAPTLTASNATVTTTNASTLYIGGAPKASTNETITTSAGIYIPSNAVNSSGSVGTAASLYAVAPTGATNNYAGYFGGTVKIVSTNSSNSSSL